MLSTAARPGQAEGAGWNTAITVGADSGETLVTMETASLSPSRAGSVDDLVDRWTVTGFPGKPVAPAGRCRIGQALGHRVRLTQRCQRPVCDCLDDLVAVDRRAMPRSK